MAIVFYKNIGLTANDTGGQTSTVGEPSLANRGRHIFYSGNWYATKSLNGGNNWTFVSPFSVLPSIDDGFCCDQTIIYEHRRDILIWLLQYIKRNGTNTLRVAVNKGATLNDSDWYWWDFQPVNVNPGWNLEWFDYNHAATSNNFLYVGSNVFTTTTDQFTRSVIFRFPLDPLADGTALNYSHFSTTNNFSLRCTQGATDVMYFASHNSFSQIRLFAWPENATAISARTVNVSPWSSSFNYQAPGPDGRNWLSRCDPRITGGWVANGTLGFAWSANRMGTRPFPHVRVIRIDENSMALVDEPDIWNENYAFAYPAICPNARGDVGISLFRGGGPLHPGHLVGAFNDTTDRWDLRATRNGSDGPNDGKWGDYLGINRYSNRGNSWFASGYTLQGGGNRSNIDPQVVQFGFRG